MNISVDVPYTGEVEELVEQLNANRQDFRQCSEAFTEAEREQNSKQMSNEVENMHGCMVTTSTTMDEIFCQLQGDQRLRMKMRKIVKKTGK